VNTSTQLVRRLVEYLRIAACRQKIDRTRMVFGPEPQQADKPGLGPTHPEAIDDLQDPDWTISLHE
jgi:hypothetical protein